MDHNAPKSFYPTITGGHETVILEELKRSCYTNNDVRASWITDYALETDIIEYKNYAK